MKKLIFVSIIFFPMSIFAQDNKPLLDKCPDVKCIESETEKINLQLIKTLAKRMSIFRKVAEPTKKDGSTAHDKSEKDLMDFNNIMTGKTAKTQREKNDAIKGAATLTCIASTDFENAPSTKALMQMARQYNLSPADLVKVYCNLYGDLAVYDFNGFTKEPIKDD